SESTSTTFARPVAPATTRTEPRGTSSVAASKSTSAAFARPRSGGAATRAFQPSPCLPTSSVRAAPGETVALIRAREIARELFEDGDVVVCGLLGVRDRERPLLLAARRREDPTVQVVEPGELGDLDVLARHERLVVDDLPVREHDAAFRADPDRVGGEPVAVDDVLGPGHEPV